MIDQKVFLHQLSIQVPAHVVAVSGGAGEDARRVVERLMEFGFLPGENVVVLHQAPVSGDPIAVRVRGTTVALRRAEAAFVEVVLVPEGVHV